MMAEFHYGGQAVMEGVMMRGRKHMATVVRRPNGELVNSVQPVPSLYSSSSRLRTIPLVRGVTILIETLALGIKTLTYSANVALEEEGEKMEGWPVWLVMAFALAVAVAIFFLTPLFITRVFSIESTVLFNLVEGVIRLVFFIAYLWLISLMPDIKRVFAYHGAEHKTINAYEAGVPLEVEAIKGYGRAHVRCGSSFMFMVLLIAILVFSLIGRPALWLMVLSRILLIPVIAAFGYELVYFAGRHADNLFVKVIIAPGLWLQSMTTREPDDGQIEVGIAALKLVLEAERAEESPAEAVSEESYPASEAP